VLELTWRQYRLERRMFWRNPSAAFFNFVLPLLFLALFGAIFAGSQEDLEVIVPGIAGMSIVSTTFVAIAHNLVFLREQGVLKRLRGTPLPAPAYFGALAAHAVTNAAVQLRSSSWRGGRSSGSAGRRTGCSSPCSRSPASPASRCSAPPWPTRSRTSTARRPTSTPSSCRSSPSAGSSTTPTRRRRSCATSRRRCRSPTSSTACRALW
jgi:hypothetical protein